MTALVEMDRKNGIIHCTPQAVAELVAEIRRLRAHNKVLCDNQHNHVRYCTRIHDLEAEIERLRDAYHILKRDYDALRAEVEPLRTTLGYLADNINEPALVAVAETALKPKP